MHSQIELLPVKMTRALHFVVFLGLVCVGYGAHLPPTFQKCKRSDAECLQKAIEAAIKDLKDGYKELGINPVDPLNIPEIHAPGSGNTVKIDQKYKNVVLHGLSTTEIQSASIDVDNNCFLKCKALTPVLSTLGDYDFKGQLLLIPIDSKGHSNITLINLKTDVELDCKKFDKKGKGYLEITDFKLTFSPDNVNLFYDKVFEGNSDINEQISKILNENSMTIFNDAKPDWEKAYGMVFKQIANQIFKNVPLDEIFLS